jgi:hypothetical protein
MSCHNRYVTLENNIGAAHAFILSTVIDDAILKKIILKQI